MELCISIGVVAFCLVGIIDYIQDVRIANLKKENEELRAQLRLTQRALDFAPASRSNCTVCGGLLPKHNLPCKVAQSQ